MAFLLALHVGGASVSESVFSRVCFLVIWDGVFSSESVFATALDSEIHAFFTVLFLLELCNMWLKRSLLQADDRGLYQSLADSSRDGKTS